MKIKCTSPGMKEIFHRDLMGEFGPVVFDENGEAEVPNDLGIKLIDALSDIEEASDKKPKKHKED